MTYWSSFDLRDFYNSRIGHAVCQVLRKPIAQMWDDTKGQTVLGIGYTSPYLDLFLDKAESCFSVVQAGQQAFVWPEAGKNLTVLAEGTELPFETNSIDKVLMVHSFENAEHLQASLQEIFRVLKSTGRVLCVVPNRLGLWARAEWSPLGQGSPCTLSQLKWYLRDNNFVFEKSRQALFLPPLRWNFITRSPEFLEKAGPYLFPALAGVNIVEASKQIYAGIEQAAAQPLVVRGRRYSANPVAVRKTPHHT